VRKIFTEKAAVAESGIGRVYDAAEIVAKGGDPAAFLALEATPGFQFGPGFAKDYVGPAIYKATHGYDPSRPEMRASLMLFGPNVPHGTIAGARLVDIAPTIAAWLGVAMPDVDGKPLQVTPAP
jgi:predicted AlkP superfamily pyrophosphatase or phosphodiesterase